MAKQDDALVQFEAALATLRGSSAAGYPESFVFRTIKQLEAGIAIYKGEEPNPVPDPQVGKPFPEPKNRGDVPEPVKPIKAPAAHPKGWVATYEDGETLENADRTKFPDKSSKGAKRKSIEPKK